MDQQLLDFADYVFGHGEFDRVHLRHTLVCHHVASSDLVAAVAVQWGVGVRINKQINNGSAQRFERPNGRIMLRFQDVEADFACLEMDVRMEAFCEHLDFWWINRVILADLEF